MEIKDIITDWLRKRVAWLAAAILIGIIPGLIQNYRHSFRNIPVSIAQGLEIRVYKATSDRETISSGDTPLYSLDVSQPLRLRNGTTYDFVINDPTHQYTSDNTWVTVDKETANISITKPFYSKSVLAKMLSNERSTIQNTLLNTYASLSDYYSFGNDRLYGYGNWYGVVLVSNNPGVYDTLRVIMQQENGSWKVIGQPQISIGAPANPSIPLSVLSSVDQL